MMSESSHDVVSFSVTQDEFVIEPTVDWLSTRKALRDEPEGKICGVVTFHVATAVNVDTFLVPKHLM